MTARTTAIELEFEFDRAVVGSGDLVVDPRAAHGVAQPVIDEKIVQAPSDVTFPRPHPHRPPGVAVRRLRLEMPPCIQVADLANPVYPRPLLGQESGVLGVLIAAVIGSVALIPGPIAYPLAGMLLERGVTYTVLAVFITTLMMVGVITFPVEKEYFGTHTAVLRNLLSFAGALLVGMIMGVLL